MTAKRITPADIMEMDAFLRVRKARQAEIAALKRDRRLGVGPHATFYFESYETMWWQVHEMLRIERGGAEQVADELSAYNPLIPQGRELVATLMFEIDQPVLRQTVLARLGGVEEQCFIAIAGQEIAGEAEADLDRTTAEGKASSVQFIHFPFTEDQAARFKAGTEPAMLGIRHPNYGHMAAIPPAVRAALARDLD